MLVIGQSGKSSVCANFKKSHYLEILVVFTKCQDNIDSLLKAFPRSVSEHREKLGGSLTVELQQGKSPSQKSNVNE